MIKKEGNISNFIYKNKNHQNEIIKLQINEGIFFKGSQTYHSVDVCKDPKAVRWMLGFQYNPVTKNTLSRSFCSELRGLITKVFIYFCSMTVVYNLICIYTIFLKVLINDYYLFVCMIYLLSSYHIPKFLPKHIGTGINTNSKQLLIYSLFCLMTFIFILFWVM